MSFWGWGLRLGGRRGGGVAPEGGGFPASLFADGEKGVIIDPSNLSTLWVEHDSQTTQVAADNDRVGTVTGFQNTTLAALSATGAASRGTYKTSAGLHWLNFASAEWLQGTIGAEIVPPLVVVACARLPAAELFATAIANPADSNTMHMCYRKDPNAYTWSRTNGNQGNQLIATGMAADTAAVSSHRIITASNLSVQVNKSAAVNSVGTLTLYTGGASDLLSFPDIRDDTPSLGVGDLYFLLIINRDLTAQELSDLQTYAGAKGGLTI